MEVCRQFREGRDIGDGSMLLKKLSIRKLAKLANARRDPYQRPSRVKEVECDQCDAKFAERKELIRHRRDAHPDPNEEDGTRIHHEFRCAVPGCMKSYKTRGWLLRHQLNWHKHPRNSPDPNPPYPPTSPGPISRLVMVPQTGSSTEGGGIHRTADVSASSRRGFGVSSHLAASDWTDRLNPGTGEAL